MATVAILGVTGQPKAQRFLRRSGHRIVPVKSLFELNCATREDALHVILIEPSRTISTAEYVRIIGRDALFERVAILPLLPRSDIADRMRSLWYGAANVVDLPLREAELLAAVDAVLDRAQRAECLHRVS